MKNKEKDDLHELDLTTETTLLLRTAGIKTIEALVKKTPQELLKVKRIGAQRIRQIQSALKEKKKTLKGYDLWDGKKEHGYENRKSPVYLRHYFEEFNVDGDD